MLNAQNSSMHYKYQQLRVAVPVLIRFLVAFSEGLLASWRE